MAVMRNPAEPPTSRTGLIYVQHDCIGAHDPSIPEDRLHDRSGRSLWRCPTCGTIWEPLIEGRLLRGEVITRIVDWHLIAAPARDAMIHEIYQDLGMEGPLR